MKPIYKSMFIIIALFAVTFTTLAQPGTLDPTFNPTHIPIGTTPGANSDVLISSIQSDGKIIIGGNFTSYNGITRNRIARLNVNGTIDETFNPGTGADSLVKSISVQSNGKIIIGGKFTTYNGTARNRIARLNADGTLDGTFIPATGVEAGLSNVLINTTSIQSNGKIIIGGNFVYIGGTLKPFFARLHGNGTLDNTFNTGTGPNFTVRTTSIQSDGKIIIGGEFVEYNGNQRNGIVRINIDGTLDNTFNPGTGANNSVEIISIQSDGKIIIGGMFTSYNGSARNRIARLNVDGTLDDTFNPGTGANGSAISTIAIQNDGKIIIGGDFDIYNGTARNRIARLNADGTLNTGFNPGAGGNNAVQTARIQSDGKIIIGGMFTTYNGVVTNRSARLNINGTLDTTFLSVSGANNSIVTTSIQSDGKIIIGGDFNSYNGIARNNVARLNNDGTLDVAFSAASVVGTNNWVRTTSIQSDGKIIIGGDFSLVGGVSTKRLARLQSNGNLDYTFTLGTANDVVFITSIQSDGKIIIGGNFTSYNGSTRNRIARLNVDGTLDDSFNSGTGIGTNQLIKTISIQSDGKIIIGGLFTSYTGTSRNGIARLNADGTLDDTFNPGTGAYGQVTTTSIQSDGKIIIGGDFSSYNGISRNRIARLNVDGTLDGTFDPGTGVYGIVWTTSIQNDGKIIIGGSFTSYNGTARNRIAILNVDGTLDITFNPGTGANVNVRTTSIQSDGKIIIGGEFSSYNGINRNRIARINGSTQLSTSFFEKKNMIIYPNPTQSILNLSLNNGPVLDRVQIIDITGKVVLEQFQNLATVQVERLAKGIYILTAYSGDKKYQEKFIKQ